MILLTRLNNRPFTVNSDLIKFIEQSPDTVITLLNGEKLLVLESAEEVRNRVVEFRRTILHGMHSAPCPAAPGSSAPSASDPAKQPPEERAGR
jgi:flagellar protein FlbD